MLRITCIRQAIVCWVFLASCGARAEEARIVLLQGRGEKSAEEQPSAWSPATQGDSVAGGNWVRTLANSQMGLTVPDRNQIRLNQNSTMQIKTAEDAAAYRQTRVNLVKGRAWSQARPRAVAGTGGAGAKNRNPALAMRTPSATLSIRGTDWEVEVAENGSMQVVVLSGVVDVDNAQGSVSVAAGEAARAEMGKAPVKFVLVNPQSRVQWVSSWEPRAARWIGTESPRYAAEIRQIDNGDYAQALARLLPRADNQPGAAVLAADILIYQGTIEQAVSLLAQHARAGSGDERAVALLSRALLRLDRGTEAMQLLDAGLATHPGSGELRLALGEAAVLEGDAALARRSFGAVAETPSATQGPGANAEAAEGWYGLGLVSSEREFVHAARRELAESLRLDPGLDKAAAELAAVETFAGNLGEAETRYDALLARNSANYLALTGRGINRLKAGDASGALEDFLQAGLVEPRYARAWLYQGVAFYRLGEAYRAEQAFLKAEALDVRDPVPHMMASQTATDALDYPRAINEAREAQRKLPWLKSLNQLQNDQRGSANLGAPLAASGYEEWSKYYADEAYTPFWGGSQLFLADRYTGLFNKNSALMSGFLADPLAFGASNRKTSLVQSPGHYRRVDAGYERDDYDTPGTALTLNGLVQQPVRGAYFLQAEAKESDARRNGTEGRKGSVTAGIGLAPREDLGIFGFLVDNTLNADIRNDSTPDANLGQTDRVGDLGLRWSLNPENQFWLKGGTRDQQSDRSGITLLPELSAQFLPVIMAYNEFLPYVPEYIRDIPLPGDVGASFTRLDIEGDDLQFRHALRAGGALWSWGVEDAEQEQALSTRITLRPLRTDFNEAFRAQSRSAWADVGFSLAENVDAELGMVVVDGKTERRTYSHDRLLPWYVPEYLASFTLPTLEVTSEEDTDLDVRAGLSWRPTDGQRLRLVAQRWHRPASFGTLAPVETLGIAVNDRLPAPGGEYERVRLQYDGEWTERVFLQLFADQERVDNGLAGQRTAGFSYQIEALGQLRQTADFFSPRDDLEETPIFPSGSMRTLGGAVNWQAARPLSLALRYMHRDSDNDLPGPAGHDWIPYIPRHFAQLRAQWNTPWRLLLSASALWRSERLERQLEVVGTDTVPVVDAGWSFGVRAYWESEDKHHTVQALVDDLAPERDAMSRNYRDPLYRLQYSYRF